MTFSFTNDLQTTFIHWRNQKQITLAQFPQVRTSVSSGDFGCWSAAIKAVFTRIQMVMNKSTKASRMMILTISWNFWQHGQHVQLQNRSYKRSFRGFSSSSNGRKSLTTPGGNIRSILSKDMVCSVNEALSVKRNFFLISKIS